MLSSGDYDLFSRLQDEAGSTRLLWPSWTLRCCRIQANKDLIVRVCSDEQREPIWTTIGFGRLESCPDLATGRLSGWTVGMYERDDLMNSLEMSDY